MYTSVSFSDGLTTDRQLRFNKTVRCCKVKTVWDRGTKFSENSFDHKGRVYTKFHQNLRWWVRKPFFLRWFDVEWPKKYARLLLFITYTSSTLIEKLLHAAVVCLFCFEVHGLFLPSRTLHNFTRKMSATFCFLSSLRCRSWLRWLPLLHVTESL